MAISNQFFCSSLMDPHWFSLSTSGALIVSWAGNAKQSETEIEPIVDIGGQNIDHTNALMPPTLKIDRISSKGKIVLKHKGYDEVISSKCILLVNKCKLLF